MPPRPSRPGGLSVPPRQQLHGLHVFTGQATSPSEALACTHQVYDAALAARKAGLDKPGRW
ncbi:hypothetical protein ACWDUC_22595 [Streptomyces tricolor]